MQEQPDRFTPQPRANNPLAELYGSLTDDERRQVDQVVSEMDKRDRADQRRNLLDRLLHRGD